jgi:predicted Rossmann fold nucleotide-binding protein DprA/Smf involved in DNA uptake
MALEGKYGASVVTSGGGDEGPIACYLNHFLTVSGATPVDAIWSPMGTFRPENQVSDRCREQARDLGATLVKAWKEKRRSVMAEKGQEAHRERMQKLIGYHKDEWPYEYQYWKGRS